MQFRVVAGLDGRFWLADRSSKPRNWRLMD